MRELWLDTHCHLSDDHLEELVEGLGEARVGGVVVVGTDLESSRSSQLVARSLRRHAPDLSVGSTIGVHPHDAQNYDDQTHLVLEQLLAEDEEHLIVGVGECGLDYFYEHSPREKQRFAFEAQIELARASDRTLVIHTRDAWSETFELLESRPLPERIVFHCFIGGEDELQRSLALGAYISVSGIVTFKNSHELREVVQMIPRDRIMVETDSPYLTPVPLRGRPNEPRNVAITGEFIAQLRGVDIETFQEETTSNALRAFQLDSLRR